MPVPFKVKAVFEYKSAEPDDLNFGNGQIITVTEDDDEDWYTGEYTDSQGQLVEGIFPRNFVEKYEPAIPSRPARTTRRPAQPEPADIEPQSQNVVATTEPALSSSVRASRADDLDSPRDVIEAPVLPKQTAIPAETKPTIPDIEQRPIENKGASAKPPPPVAEKPASSSFRDRIAAFNKPAAAPVAPIKPGGAGGSGFVKKPFVAPPPSRNAYVAQPREPPARIYRREEDPDMNQEEPQGRTVAEVPVSGHSQPDDDQPKPTSLKDRIALLQKQQLEQAARNADAAKKKEKPKKPAKLRQDTDDVEEEFVEPPLTKPSTRETLGAKSIEVDHHHDEEELPHTQAQVEPRESAMPPPPSQELVSDTNDADDSGAGDTEDAQDLSTEEENPRIRTGHAPLVDQREAKEVVEGENEEAKGEAEEDTEEDEDPEVRRRRELRDRMAKMSGGIGMMGMFGGGMPASHKPKALKEETQSTYHEEENQDESRRAPPVPVMPGMALPGMSTTRARQEVESASDEEITAEQTPVETQVRQDSHKPTDHIFQQPARKSTDRAAPVSPPVSDAVIITSSPPPPVFRPEAPRSPGARPVPPPPPPTKAAGELPLSRSATEELDLEAADPSIPAASLAEPSAVPRAVPPPPPGRPKAVVDTTEASERPLQPSPTSPQSRPPPPPPPAYPPTRRSTSESVTRPDIRDDSEDEVTEYDGDYDTDIASSAKHKDALKSHNRDSSYDEGALTDDATRSPTSPPTRAVPPIPQASATREVPPPPPQTLPKVRKSTDAPRTAPPPVPPPKIPDEQREEDYDPYRYSAPQHGIPSPPLTGRQGPILQAPLEEKEQVDMYGTTPQLSRIPPPPAERAAPPPPPADRVAPPPPPPQTSAMSAVMSGGLSAPKRSMDVGRSPTVSRRSMEGGRAGLDPGFIASDVDLVPESVWWTHDGAPPPSLRSRSDVLYEVESSTSTKRGGQTAVTRDVYVLYQDYSQTTINVTFDPADPGRVAIEQNHQRPPPAPRQDQLEDASRAYGSLIARTANGALGSTVGDGGAQEFIMALLRPLTTALMPVGIRAYGALVYANLGNASTQQFDEIRPGDIITFRNAKFSGHKGGLHQKYSMDVGRPEHVGVVIDWDGTKKKVRAWEQGRDEKGKRPKVREESFKVGDLKSGEVRVWRVMPRSYVNWGTS